jgi:NADPH-dependent 2,4-dienoyl-CoA reductase/sulfur reductase-like enzyme/rhodanese-related sulfurtransferase
MKGEFGFSVAHPGNFKSTCVREVRSRGNNMDKSVMTIVIVGGVAGGASAATRARRMNENAEIILFEKDGDVSFANCGLPYYIGGEITDRDELLMATPEFLARRFSLDVRTRQEVTSINREAKTVMARNHETGEAYEQRYDKLILAPGASPLVPPIDGVDSRNVFTLRNLPDTDRIKTAVESSRSKKAAVIGAGYIGLEMVEQLINLGFHTTLVELQPQVMPVFDKGMVQPLEKELRIHGVELHLGDGIKRIVTDAKGVARGVEMESGATVEVDLVILAMGVRPNVRLAKEAGLKLGQGGGVSTNEYMQTSDRDIYAVGDVAEYVFGPTGDAVCIALAGPANRAGRLAGEHAATGKSSPMASVYGTSIVRVFDRTAALAGLTVKMARERGKTVRSVTVIAGHHAGYYPGARSITIKLVFDPKEGRVLGAQIVGSEGVDKRIDVLATAMAMNATVRDIAGLDFAYAPPFGSAKDPIHMAAFAACNQLDGLVDFIDADADLNGKEIVDVRTVGEVRKRPLTGADRVINIPVDELRERIGELDKTAETVVSCRVGFRSYLASRILQQRGFTSVRNLCGGAIMRKRAMAARDRRKAGSGRR